MNNPSCPKCFHTLSKNGFSKKRDRRWACRKARGGCGYTHTDSNHAHGGLRVEKVYESNAERQRAHRERKKSVNPKN